MIFVFFDDEMTFGTTLRSPSCFEHWLGFYDMWIYKSWLRHNGYFTELKYQQQEVKYEN